MAQRAHATEEAARGQEPPQGTDKTALRKRMADAAKDGERRPRGPFQEMEEESRRSSKFPIKDVKHQSQRTIS